MVILAATVATGHRPRIGVIGEARRGGCRVHGGGGRRFGRGLWNRVGDAIMRRRKCIADILGINPDRHELGDSVSVEVPEEAIPTARRSSLDQAPEMGNQLTRVFVE